MMLLHFTPSTILLHMHRATGLLAIATLFVLAMGAAGARRDPAAAAGGEASPAACAQRLENGICLPAAWPPAANFSAVLKMPPCHYGQAFQGGCRPGAGGVLDVGEADLELALAVIANFDLVLVLENLGNANYQRYVHDLLNLPANFPNSFPHSNSGKHHVDLPPALRALLEDENALDLRLYDLVRALEEMKVAAWWEGLGEEGAWDEEPGDG